MTTPVGGITAAPMAAPSQADSAMSALSGMGSDGFLKLLVAQLRYQSPLEPSDPGDMMVQTSQLAQLDASQQLAALQRRDLGLQHAVLATNLLGADVTGVDADGGPVEGVVEGVRYTTAGPVLDIGGGDLPLERVTEVRRNPD
jgi:flagellar basal-body rod modification protein FlgD